MIKTKTQNLDNVLKTALLSHVPDRHKLQTNALEKDGIVSNILI